MRIQFLPTKIEYRHEANHVQFDALEFGIALARHLSMTHSPADPRSSYERELKNATSQKTYDSSHTSSTGAKMFLTSILDRGVLLVMFGPPGKSPRRPKARK
jgi:hypothetical protein